jgi:hypothetical protein
VGGDRCFRLRFRLDQRIAHAVLERVARAAGRGRVFDVGMRLHHRPRRYLTIRIPSMSSSSAARSVVLSVFCLNADHAFIAIANVAGDRRFKAGGAVNGPKAYPTLLLAINNLATPIALVANGSGAHWHKLDSCRFRSFDLCG